MLGSGRSDGTDDKDLVQTTDVLHMFEGDAEPAERRGRIFLWHSDANTTGRDSA